VGPGNHVLDGGPDPPWEWTTFSGGKGRPIVKYRDTLQLSVQKWLKRLRCHLGCGLGWAQGILLDGVQIAHGKGQFWGERVARCKVLRLSAMSCAEKAEPIDLPFGLWTRAGQVKHKLNHICQVAPM